MTNLFVVKNQQVFTSKIVECGVKGIMREVLLEQTELSIKETILSKEDVLQADELFVTNSVIGIWPIRQLEAKTYPIGKLTQQLMIYLSDLKTQDLKLC
jgi:4-amino-4-deoxychorismate lyase